MISCADTERADHRRERTDELEVRNEDSGGGRPNQKKKNEHLTELYANDTTYV